MQWHFHPLSSAWQRVGSSISPCCPFGQEMPEKGNASHAEFHAGVGKLIPPAPLDSASFESTPALLQRSGRRQTTQHMST